MFTNGIVANATYEYICIGESTVIESLRNFVKAVLIEIFENEYLRSPNQNDICRLLEMGEERGFSGMLGSIDCMRGNANGAAASSKCCGGKLHCGVGDDVRQKGRQRSCC